MPTYNPGVTPTWVFTPNTSAPANVQINNPGRYPVYVGPAGVTQAGGLAIPPGGNVTRLVGVGQTLYAVSGVAPGAIGGTQSSGATAGSTAITLAATVPTALSAGTYVVIGSTASTGWEAQLVATTTASSQLTFAQPLVNDHYSAVVYAATFLPAQVHVRPGVL